MKNIHLIPTDNYSPLVLSSSRYGGLFLSKYYSPMKEMGDSYQNIYITSDEEIKEGDWVYTPDKNIMLVTAKYATESSFMIGNGNHEKSPYYIEFCRKIILTIDQDLIKDSKDGIQRIDDEFLEWFVKNPSCEEVGVVKDSFQVDQNNPVLKGSTSLVERYKIIIPLEEDKQSVQEYEQQGLEKHSYELQQETIEEAVNRLWNDPSKQLTSKNSFIEGAKWQQERMYSEEEVLEILIKSEEFTSSFNSRTDLTKWFVHFRKK